MNVQNLLTLVLVVALGATFYFDYHFSNQGEFVKTVEPESESEIMWDISSIPNDAVIQSYQVRINSTDSSLWTVKNGMNCKIDGDETICKSKIDWWESP